MRYAWKSPGSGAWKTGSSDHRIIGARLAFHVMKCEPGTDFHMVKCNPGTDYPGWRLFEGDGGLFDDVGPAGGVMLVDFGEFWAGGGGGDDAHFFYEAFVQAGFLLDFAHGGGDFVEDVFGGAGRGEQGEPAVAAEAGDAGF